MVVENIKPSSYQYCLSEMATRIGHFRDFVHSSQRVSRWIVTLNTE